MAELAPHGVGWFGCYFTALFDDDEFGVGEKGVA